MSFPSQQHVILILIHWSFGSILIVQAETLLVTQKSTPIVFLHSAFQLLNNLIALWSPGMPVCMFEAILGMAARLGFQLCDHFTEPITGSPPTPASLFYWTKVSGHYHNSYSYFHSLNHLSEFKLRS